MRTQEQIKKGCKKGINELTKEGGSFLLTCGEFYNKDFLQEQSVEVKTEFYDTLFLCPTCQSLLQYSNEIIEKIDKYSGDYKSIIANDLAKELKSSIIGEAK